MAITTKYPEDKNPNQKQGPRTGNTGTPDKRKAFIKEKSDDWREKISQSVMSALETRGRGGKPYVDPAVEGLSSNTNTGPKKNSTADGAKLPKKYGKPGTRLKP
jgi:hypothetical protein